MSLTRRDIREAAFTDQYDEVQELSISSKGLVDLGCINELTSLAVLSLPFNALTSLTALSTLLQLQHLNVSHNRLTHLKGLPASITCLKASNNGISSVTSLTKCTKLQELWLQHNKLASLADLQPLAQLASLQRLCVLANPCTKQSPSDTFQGAVISFCTQLQVLDGQHVTEAQRQAGLQRLNCLPPGSTALESSASMACTALDPCAYSSSLSFFPTAASNTTHRGASSHSGRLPSVTRAAAAAAAAGRRAASTGSTDQGSSRLPYTLPARRGSYGTVLSGAADGIGGMSADMATPCSPRSGSASPNDNAQPGFLLPSTLLDSDTMSVASSKLSCVTRATAASAGRRFGQDVPRIKQLPVTSKFQAVLAALPQVDKARLPPTYTPGQGRSRKLQPTPAPADATSVVHQARYPAGSRCQALRCCKNGSLTINWPSGDLAVTVDVDHSTTPVSYRMLALYRNTSNVAASWDASGGFVQYANGALCLVYNAASMSGTKFSPSGDVLLKWTDQDSKLRDCMDILVGASEEGVHAGPLGANGVVSTVTLGQVCGGSTAAGSDLQQQHAAVDVLLDAHFGIRFCRNSRQLSLYWACEGLKHLATCGFNGPEAQAWQTVGAGTLPYFLPQLASNSASWHGGTSPARDTQAEVVAAQDGASSVAGLLAKLSVFNARMRDKQDTSAS